MSDAGRIQSTIDAMVAAFTAHDTDCILQAYEPDAVVVGEPGSPSHGAPALRAVFERFIAVDPKFAFADHEVIVAGDLALHLAPWRMTGTAPDGSAIADRGLSVAVLRRQADGRWLMVIDDPYGDRLLRT